MLVCMAAVRKVTQQGRVSQDNGFCNFCRSECDGCVGMPSISVDGPTRCRFPDSLCEGVLFVRYAEELFHHCLLVSKQSVDFRVALPTCCVGLRVIDGELHGERIWVRAPVTLDQMQFLAMGMSISVEPALVVQTDCVNDKSISFPCANGIAHPS